MNKILQAIVDKYRLAHMGGGYYGGFLHDGRGIYVSTYGEYFEIRLPYEIRYVYYVVDRHCFYEARTEGAWTSSVDKKEFHRLFREIELNKEIQRLIEE